jgi:hypothetical protein
MQLKYSYGVSRGKIVVELETADFTTKETMALDMLGEPLVEFQKSYNGDFMVSISKKLRTEFKIKQKFDGTKDFEAANAAATEFLDDVKEILQKAMDDLMDRFLDQDFPARTGSLKVTEYK